MAPAELAPPEIGVVVIGRNEGERLRRCLEALGGGERQVVYVDSGSTDSSVELARCNGADVVDLDLRIPFTAARARNAGWRRLLELAPGVAFVQFIDGDCELAADWLQKASAFLGSRADVAAVCGRRRERYPDHSIYNLLCDFEWDTPVGEARACGGDVLVRMHALRAAGGYRDGLIAGEEPELCVRLRQAGWRVWRLDAEMTSHDAAMTRFGQWWRRTVRSGHAFAEGAWLHGAPPERHWVRESRSACFWGLIIPLAILVSTGVFGIGALALTAIYPLQIARIALRGKRELRKNLLQAMFQVLGKFPEMLGQLRFVIRRMVGAEGRLIEYK